MMPRFDSTSGHTHQWTLDGFCSVCGMSEPKTFVKPVEPMDFVDAAGNLTPAEELLKGWFKAWDQDEAMPAKTTNAVHIRTAIYFVERYHDSITRYHDSITRA